MGYWRLSRQNLETKGLRGKIFRNKDLAGDFEMSTNSGEMYSLEAASGISPIVFPSEFSVKVVRHTKRVLICGNLLST